MAALAAYRHVLRATRVAFKGDHRVLTSAREQVKSSFYRDRYLDVGSKEAGERIEHAEAVATFLRRNLVQGEKVDVQVNGGEGGEAVAEDRYKLNVHEETERGDNDFNRLPKQGLGTLKGVGSKKFGSGGDGV